MVVVAKETFALASSPVKMSFPGKVLDISDSIMGTYLHEKFRSFRGELSFAARGLLDSGSRLEEKAHKVACKGPLF
jgi:hypothetical protein